MGDIIGLDGLRSITEKQADTNKGSTGEGYTSSKSDSLSSGNSKQATATPTYSNKGSARHEAVRERIAKIFSKIQPASVRGSGWMQRPVGGDASPRGAVVNRIGKMIGERLGLGTRFSSKG